MNKIVIRTWREAAVAIVELAEAMSKDRRWHYFQNQWHGFVFDRDTDYLVGECGCILGYGIFKENARIFSTAEPSDIFDVRKDILARMRALFGQTSIEDVIFYFSCFPEVDAELTDRFTKALIFKLNSQVLGVEFSRRYTTREKI